MFWQIILLGILFIAVGVFLFLRPDLAWMITERWKSYRADEPSDFYVVMAKIGGILWILGGIALIVARIVLD